MNKNRQAAARKMRPSDEADKRGLQLAREQGAAFQRTVEHMTQDIADAGGMKQAGDYTIGYALEKAEGMYHLQGGKLQWHDVKDENVHVEVVVCDAADNRFIPGLTVHATLTDASGHEVGTHQQSFLWHPYLYHYGRNWRVPGDGDYTLRVRVEPPDFMRHDKTNGKRFAKPVEVKFTNVRLKTGQE